MLCHKQQQERNNVFKLNENRPGKKIWNMIRKINGKLSTTNNFLIKPNKEKCTEINKSTSR